MPRVSGSWIFWQPWLGLTEDSRTTDFWLGLCTHFTRVTRRAGVKSVQAIPTPNPNPPSNQAIQIKSNPAILQANPIPNPNPVKQFQFKSNSTSVILKFPNKTCVYQAVPFYFWGFAAFASSNLTIENICTMNKWLLNFLSNQAWTVNHKSKHSQNSKLSGFWIFCQTKHELPNWQSRLGLAEDSETTHFWVLTMVVCSRCNQDRKKSKYISKQWNCNCVIITVKFITMYINIS